MIRCIAIAVAALLASSLALPLLATAAQPAALERQFDAESDGDQAPKERELETDRDAFTPASSTVGQQLTVLESSYSFIDNRDVAATHSFPELLVRYGLTELVELRIGWNYEVGGAGDTVAGNEGSSGLGAGRIERESQTLYGVKLAVSKQAGWIPRSATILQGYTPTSGDAPATDVVAAYTFGWELPRGWRLDSSMRYGTEHDAHDAFNEWAPSAVLRVPVTEKWHVHAEYFGIYSQGAAHDTSHAFFSPGAHYLITPNLELGSRVGWGLTTDSPGFFSNVGIGWRF